MTRAILFAIAAGLLAACYTGAAPFQCESDQACNVSPGGQCWDQTCAYPNAECGSGWRWHGGAHDGVCVPDEALPDASEVDTGADAAPVPDAEAVPPRSDAAPGCAMRALFLTGDSKREVWSANADGTGTINLSNSTSADDFWPFWSPDGSRVLFMSDRSGAADIWTVAPDGTDARNLTQTNVSAESMASWSPDGRKIAFWRDGGVWIMASDGSLVTPITMAAASEYVGLQWSPDGRFLLIGVRATTGYRLHDLYLVPLAGGDLKNITNTPDVNETIARFSPDGTRIVYAAAALNSRTDVWTAAADGSVTRFSDGAAVAGVVHLDGSALVMLSGATQVFTWSPCLKVQP